MLKQLKLQSELKQRRKEQSELLTRKADFEKRQAELAKALEEAETDEDINLVNTQIEELEKEVGETDIEEKSATVTAEIQRIEGELEELEQRSGEPKKQEPKTHEERGNKAMPKMQVRELLRTGEYYERAEVKEFYNKFKNFRSVGGEGLTVPNLVVNRIMDIMGDYCTVYPLVNEIRAKGTVRILIDTDTTAATWIEQTGAVPTGEVGTITNIDFDGFKIGKCTFVDNCMLQDSIINLDEYVTKKLARAIALGLDKAILKGEGAAQKQPDGIIPKLSETHKVTALSDNLVEIVKPIGLIDTGEDSVGEIVAVMKRSTYYNRFLEFSINVNADGNVVGKLPNIKSPDLLGLRVVFNNNMDEDNVLYGDFDKYTLVNREDIRITSSDQVKFTEDQTGFKGIGRFDGKPTKPDAFVLVTITEPVEV